MKKHKLLGIVLYKGKSMIDGNQIVAIATGIDFKSENEKIGDMIQVWILRPDITPELAARLGFDYSICGDCKHRDFGSCYVNMRNPHQVFNAYHRDRYVPFTPELLKHFEGRSLRIGAYGDPAAVPTRVWKNVCSVVKSYTGYTHRWKVCDPELKNYCMASCDTEEEHKEAVEMGWRTFRIRGVGSPLLDNEFACPASREAGRKTNCSKCRACMGIKSHTHKNAAIQIHGADFKVERFTNGIRRIKNKRRWRVNFEARMKALKMACGQPPERKKARVTV